MAIGRISSEASGATTTPPITTPVAGRQKILTNPSVQRPASWPAALVDSGSMIVRAGTSPASIARWPMPTVAISGWVKTLRGHRLQPHRRTPSPSACHIAIRPCMAATEASISTPVQSPAA